MTHGDEEAVRITREVAARAIRRLDILEWVILGGAMALAVAGGAFVAWVLSPVLAFEFRSTWMVASVLLFVIPGAIAIRKARMEERQSARSFREPSEDKEDG